MSNGKGYRGYIGSRSYACGDFPQHMQNLLIRNYCQKYQLEYLLSATEYAMPGCYMMLEEVLSSVNSLKGIVMFSLFMLPTQKSRRERIYHQVLASGATLHAALEDLSIHSYADIYKVEDIINLNEISLAQESLHNMWGTALA